MIQSHLIRASLISTAGLAIALAAACSPGTGTEPTGGGAAAGDGDSGSGSSGGDGDGGGDGDIIVPGDGDLAPGETCDPAVDPVTGMEICACIKIATWGALGTYGAVPGMDGTDAITAWLNANSTGTADYTVTKPAITAEALEPYDVIIIQDISAWAAFTPDEIAAFNAWVAAGGGAISLNGYSGNGLEMTNVNALLASTGMSYVANSDTFATNTAVVCGYCYGNSVPQGGWTTHPIAANITYVGAFHGRSIMPGDAEVVAQSAEGVVAAAKPMGEGRVFMFHDEWVTYNSQWTGEGITGSESCIVDPNNMCYMVGPKNDYQSAQFWYNAIKWVSGGIECFRIEDPGIVK